MLLFTLLALLGACADANATLADLPKVGIALAHRVSID